VALRGRAGPADRDGHRHGQGYWLRAFSTTSPGSTSCASDPAARIPNITNRQGGRGDPVHDHRPNAGAAGRVFAPLFRPRACRCCMSPRGKYKTYDELIAAGEAGPCFRAAESLCRNRRSPIGLPQAQAIQLDTQANVIQAVEGGRADVAMVDTSTVRLAHEGESGSVRGCRAQLLFDPVWRRRCARATRTGCVLSTRPSPSRCTDILPGYTIRP